MITPTALLAALCVLLPQETEVKVSIRTVENTVYKGSAVTVKMEGGSLTAVITTAKGEKRVLCDIIVEIMLGPRAPEPAPVPELVRLELTTGDVLYGMLADPPGGGGEPQVVIRTKILGEQSFGFSKISSLGRTTEMRNWPPEPPKDRTLSHLFTSTGETIKGVIVRSIDTKVLRFKWRDLRNQPKRMDEVAAVYFSKFGDPPSLGKDIVAVVDLADASQIRGRLTRYDAMGAALTDLFGNAHAIGAGAIRSISFRNGRVVYVSDLAPAAVEENANYIRTPNAAPGDLAFPHRSDRNASGGGLSIRGRTFRKGIGVHAYSSLEYTLNEEYERFLVTVGIDDCAEGRGNADFQVYADGTLVKSVTLRGRDAPYELDLKNLSLVTTLKLVVDFGADGGVSDYADWAGARLIRK